MPLVYETRQPLDLSGLTFNADDVTVLLVSGASYSGHWALHAFPMPSRANATPIGEVLTEATPAYRELANLDGWPETRREAPRSDPRGPGLALDTAMVWVNDACVKAGYRLAATQDDSPSIPDDERPFRIVARFVIDRRPAPAAE